jgi:hypothetical protein
MVRRDGDDTGWRVFGYITCFGGWAYSLAMLIYALIYTYQHNGHRAPEWVNLTYFLSLALAIVGSLVLARLKTTDIFIKVFQLGFKAGKYSNHDDRDNT